MRGIDAIYVGGLAADRVHAVRSRQATTRAELAVQMCNEYKYICRQAGRQAQPQRQVVTVLMSQ